MYDQVCNTTVTGRSCETTDEGTTLVPVQHGYERSTGTEEVISVPSHVPTSTPEHTNQKEQTMATKATNPLAERIEQMFATLEDLVVKAEASKEEGKALSSFVTKLNGVVSFVDGLDESDGLTILGAMNGQAEAWPVTFEAMKDIASTLSKASGLDRTEGDACVTQIRAAKELGWELAGLDDLTERADQLITRWESTSPKGTSSTGENAGKPLGFTIQSKCSCGFTRSTSKDNLNSHRYQLQQHEKDEHKHLNVAKGSTWHKDVTKALSDVKDGAVNLVNVEATDEHNGWTFEKVEKA